MSDTAYCYSTNEEDYRGKCDSVEQALAEVSDEMSGNLDGDYTVWIGEVDEAADHIERRTGMAEDVIERLEESLHDEIGYDDTILEMSKERLAELDKIIRDFVVKHGTFNAYGVKNAKEHTITIGPEEPPCEQQPLL